MSSQNNFLNNQLSFERVKNAYSEKNSFLKKELLEKGFSYPPREILFVSYKAESELQVWIKGMNKYRLFKTYDICKKSGDFGPKRRQGDKQVPEGFYHISIFNPNSDYLLSLGLNYPNTSDRILSNASDVGGSIYIHGSCETIGCLPMTDEIMKEIYILATLSKDNNSQQIPIYLFPFKFNKLTEYIFYKEYPHNINFWDNIKKEYYYFNKTKRTRSISVDSEGLYLYY